MLANARSQLLSYGTVSFAEGLATHVAKSGEEYTVTAASGTEHTASRLILATGVSDDLSTIPGLQERWGISMLHCFYCHGYEVAGRRLGVLATSDRSLQTAMLPGLERARYSLYQRRAYIEPRTIGRAKHTRSFC